MDLTTGDALDVMRVLRERSIDPRDLPEEACETVHLALKKLAEVHGNEVSRRPPSRFELAEFRSLIDPKAKRASLRNILSPRHKRTGSPRVSEKDWEYIADFAERHYRAHAEQLTLFVAANQQAFTLKSIQVELNQLSKVQEDLLSCTPDEHDVDFNERQQTILLAAETTFAAYKKRCSELGLFHEMRRWGRLAALAKRAHRAVYDDLDRRWDDDAQCLKGNPEVTEMCDAVEALRRSLQQAPEEARSASLAAQERGHLEMLRGIAEKLSKRKELL